MSRIDEALRRVSRAGEPSRPEDGVTLEDYPLEERVPEEGVSHAAQAPQQEPRSALSSHSAPPDEDQAIEPTNLRLNQKLVSGEGRDATSLEQYRSLAASLHEAQVQRGLKTVVVTSAVPNEGKTITAVNLALTFSESYSRRVLLIDADMRKPSVHEVIGIPNRKGLAEALRSDRAHLEGLRVSPLLHVLPSGRVDNSPLAGLSSERMRALLEEAASRYDWVILDTPPLALVSDAQLLARLTQAVVFVIRAGTTPFSVVNKALDELGRDHVVGIVLNGVDAEAIPATGYYGDYYGESHERSLIP